MTKREAAIVTAQTGVLIGEWADAKAYFEELLGISVVGLQDLWMFESLLKIKSHEDYMGIKVTDE